MSEYFDARKDCDLIKRATGAFSEVLLADLLPDLKLAARGCGYALAVHGSLQRDIDILAVPWTARPDDKDFLLDTLMGVIRGHVGRCYIHQKKVGRHRVRDWAAKPHGRQAIIIGLSGMCPEIDLSVMPIVEEKNDDS